MDEVFIIGDADCPRCGGKPTAELFARAVNDAYDHIVRKRGKEMLMWADRLLDGKATGYGLWEASMNGTHPAMDMIPKDIIMCDWHYEPKYPLQPTPKSTFPSVRYLRRQGLPGPADELPECRAANRFIDESLAVPSDKDARPPLHDLASPQEGAVREAPPAQGGGQEDQGRPGLNPGRAGLISRS